MDLEDEGCNVSDPFSEKGRISRSISLSFSPLSAILSLPHFNSDGAVRNRVPVSGLSASCGMVSREGEEVRL